MKKNGEAAPARKTGTKTETTRRQRAEGVQQRIFHLLLQVLKRLQMTGLRWAPGVREDGEKQGWSD